MDNNIVEKLNKSNKATLTYLTNPVYQNNVINVRETKYKYKKTDIKFYRKRLLNLTKEMLIGKFPSLYMKNIFYEYTDILIDYLITIDEADIIQEEYSLINIEAANINNSNIDISNIDISNIENNLSNIDLNNFKLKNKKTNENENTLDNFVIKNIDNDIVEKIEYLPQKKEINLKDNILKTKGIKIKTKTKNKN
tara:strand:- start:602 stop:1186 length:585 start_codon:yes stop_codon:yes gene_type:complete